MPEQLRRVETSLVAAQWAGLLQGHPDKQFSEYVLSGIVNGFRVGFDYAEAECCSVQLNLLSADTNQEVVSRYLQEVYWGDTKGAQAREMASKYRLYDESEGSTGFIAPQKPL